MPDSLTKSELGDAAMMLLDELIKGESESFIQDVYGWDPETYKRIRALMLETKAEENRVKPREHLYVEYTIAQSQGIQDLTDLIKNLDKKQQYNALVGAMRLRADLQDRIIDRGMEFGVIKKEPERKEIVAGFLISDMNQTELRTAIIGEITAVKDMMVEFGDNDILALSAGGLHYGLAAPAEVIEAIEVKSEVAEDKKPEKKAKKKRRR